ncbi:MAG: efflux RND transporter permease subunit [Deltaproteobacteria bacterium]|nr:efflux RND transporter permease subunit [Deltaproteobacteria bacterium]
MILKIIEFCAKNRALVLLFTAFLCLVGIHSLKTAPLDAIPDLSDTQVILYAKWEQSADRIEDQITYPVISALLGSPKVKAIRGISDFGSAFIYIIFEEGTDLYWARSRMVESLAKITPKLPSGASVELGPDASSVGWIFQYALIDKSGKNSLSDLRSFQDWNLRYSLQSVEGVAEVSTVGGFVRQYQVNIAPDKLQAYNISLAEVREALKKSNQEVGGRVLEMAGQEFMIRGRGYLKNIQDIENVAVKFDPASHTSILIKQLGVVELGPDLRRGVAELNGEGQVVGGIVTLRQGENALQVIDRLKQRLNELKDSLPAGVEIVTTYDRSDIILKSIDTLKSTLFHELLIVSLVILIFLWHIPSAMIPIVTIPISILLSFILLKEMHITSNIMSLSGIAISLGVLVDGAIVEVENAYKKLELWIAGGRKGDFHRVRLEALKEVGPSVFFSLLVIAIAFLPIFSLEDQEGRLFKPLAYSKNIVMAIAALLAITLDPALRMLFTRMEPFSLKIKWLPAFARKTITKTLNAVCVGTYYPEEKHPISKVLFKIYEPICRFSLKHSKKIIFVSFVLLFTTLYPLLHLGSEFMPPLYEGSILYMPTTLPGISVTEAANLLQKQDKLLMQFPEVESVFGKVGRAETATDPAPISMTETTIILKPQDQWRKRERFYSHWPQVFQTPFQHLWPDHIGAEELKDEMNLSLQFPGVTNAWTKPIRARIDMLATGLRSPVGIKVLGNNLEEIEKIELQIESLFKNNPQVSSISSERVKTNYIDFEFKREKLGQYDMSMEDASFMISQAIGGENISTIYLGAERYALNLRFNRDNRSSLPDLERLPVITPTGEQISLSELAELKIKKGPAMIRNENGHQAAYLQFDLKTEDLGGFVSQGKKLLREKFKIPAGYQVLWSGQYESMERVKERLLYVVPLTLVLIFLLLYFNTNSAVEAALVLLAVPFSAIGAIWLLYFLDYQLSVAVWVGIIALLGLDAETGVFMLLYLNMAYNDAKQNGKLNSKNELVEAIVHGAVKRVRPKMMTVLAAFLGLLPILYSTGIGADVMKRIAAPMVGGLFSSFLLELMVYPSIYLLWKENKS